MNQKEVSELRRRFRPDKSAISRIYGCFVNSAREMVADLDESLGLMPQEEGEKYLSLLKKALSGTLGKNLIDIVFSTQQVADSEEHRLLSALRTSELKDGAARQAFYQRVIDSLDLESSYLILLAHDAYDVPRKGRDDQPQEDGSDTMFSYLVCAICPVKEGKVELGYFPGDNEFHCAASQTVAAPELGFLFPAFDDRAANIYNALFYARKPDQLHHEFIDGVFRTEPPLSAAEQKEAFQQALSEALGEDCSAQVVQALHEELAGRITLHKESKDPEPLTVTAAELAGILRACGVEPAQAEAFQSCCRERLGQGALNPENLIDAGRFQVKTAQATLTVAPEFSYTVETRTIQGRKYVLFPAEDGMEINGFAVTADAPHPETT